MKLYAHQIESLRLMAGKAYFADLSEPGTGKTLVQIENLKRNKSKRNLIVCPKSIMRAVWEEQLSANLEDYEIIVLNKGSKAASKRLSEIGNKICVIVSYDTVPRILQSLMQIKWNSIILDESTKIKSARSQRSKAIVKLAAFSERRFIMTGTPAPNGLMDVFNQYRFLSDKFFGKSWFYFRNYYFEQKPWDKWNWYPKPWATAKIKKIIAPYSVQHKKRDCVDLPPLTFETREVDMTPEQKRAYKEMKQELIVFLSSETAITAPFAVTKLMKLRQISSGFIYDESKAYDLGENKSAELLELISQINDKIIVFAYFRETLNRLYKLLPDVVAFTGKQEQIDEFRDNKRILLANPASAGHGLNLQFASTIIYYELDFNLENYLQSLDRINRIGQKNKMTVYQIIASPIEAYIKTKLDAKEDLQKELDVNKIIKNI